MTRRPRHRRSPLISILIFAVGLVLSLALIALLQLDIGAYKQQLASHLERALNTSVTLGDAELSFHNGIALDIRNLQIGDSDNFRLHIPQFTAILDPYGLLRGEIIIQQVLLDYPSLKLGLPVQLAQSTLSLDRLGLKTLQIRQGSLTITYPETDAKPLRIENFNLVLHGLGKGLVTQLATTATLFQDNQNAKFNAFFELTRQHQGQPWRQGQLRGDLSLNNLKRQFLQKWMTDKLPKRFDLTVKAKGVPAQKVLLDASLSNKQNGKPVISLTSDWKSSKAVDSFRNLKLGLVGVPLTGNLQLDHRGKAPRLSGKIALTKTRLKTLLIGASPPLTDLSGQIEKLDISFNGPLHSTAENPFSPLQSAYLKVTDMAYPLGSSRLSATSMVLEMRNARLSLQDGRGTFAQVPFQFDGTSGLLNLSQPELSFNLRSNVDLNRLQQGLALKPLKKQKFAGEIPLSLHLSGSPDQLTVNLQADLTNSALGLGILLDKKKKIPLSLQLSGLVKPDYFQLDQASLTGNTQLLQVRGDLRRKENVWSGTLDLAPFSLADLQSLSPLFTHLKLKGRVSGQMQFEGTNNLTGKIDLQEGEVHLTRVLSDLKKTTGTVNFDQHGFRFSKIRTLLGESPLQVDGNLAHWQKPQLKLHVTAQSVQARDLIFTNRQMQLQDLDGTLRIDKSGIIFDRIRLKVENKTTALVTGQMHGYHSPHIVLEASSEDADILDMIRLFSGPHRTASVPASRNKPTLELKVQVKQGRLGSFYFENAQGTINDRDSVFTLSPLTLNLGSGRVTGRVEFDRSRNHLLKISGYAQNCDADRVYEMLFEKSGIFRGTLSGDFYLEGEEIGERFWKTSHGGGHLVIRKGAMRELKGFARIFSLLNVSQLFKFRLPDMDKEGLPFSRLETSARMTKGILTINDFHITSPAINISAVGQIDTLQNTIDSTVGIKPLRTVDIILSRVPLFGWVLTGKEKALITALFTLKGPVDNPKVEAAPASSVAKTALGIIGRALSLPYRILRKTGEFLTTPPRPGQKAPPLEDNHEN